MPLSFAAFPRRIALAALSAAMAALVWGDSGGAQVLTPDPAAADAAPNGGVYVSDSAVAVDKMALATRMEKLKEWSKSADVYQEITEKYRDRVVPLGVDDQGVVDQYTSVLTLVNQHLRTWPPEGLNVYRDRFELTAKKLVDSARGDDLTPLHEAFDLYFATDSGKVAGLKLIDAYFELGDFPAATWIGQELLNHPNLTVERPGVLFRVGLAAHLAGDDKTAQAMLGELKDKSANVIGTVAGKDVTLADELGAELAKAPAESETPDQTGDSWPMIGGDVSRGKIAASPARPGAKLYSIDLAQPNWKKNIPDPVQRANYQPQDQFYRRDGKAIGVMPVADRGQLFFQDNAHVYAVNLETGAPLPGWLANYPQSNGQYQRPKAWNMPNGHPFTVSLTDSALVAVMDQPDPVARIFEVTTGQEAHVVCLDRQTGKENWSVAARDLPDDKLKTLVFDGSTLVVGNGVFFAARGFKNNGYEDCYVICLDLSSGAFRWSCYVASAPAGGSVQTRDTQMSLDFEPATHLSYASGRVFVSTNIGAVAALDAYSGAVAWLDIYRDASDAMDLNPMVGGPMARGGFGFGGWGPGIPVQQNPPTLPSPWTANAAIVHGGNVFVLPADGKFILVYDAGDGHTVKKIRKSDCPPPSIDDDPADPSASEPNALLGVMDGVQVNDHAVMQKEDLLLLGTPGHVVAVDWRNYSAEHPAVAWVTTSLNGGSIRGRPFLTNDSVYVPTSGSLFRAALRTGTLAETYPTGATWPPNEGPGNVVVCGDQIVVAGDQRVSVYSDLKFAQARLDAQIAAAPTDPELRLRYAEIMFLANQPKLAAQKLDEAAQLLAAASGPASRAVGNQAFSDAIEFAVKSWLSNADDAQVNALFDRALTLAKTPSQQANYRLTRARYEHYGAHDLAAAISLYQGILASSGQRTAAAAPSIIEDPQTGSSSDDSNALQNQAWQVAKEAIGKIQTEPNGARAYQPFEHAAATQFAAADKAKDPDALLTVAREYPNASVASRALVRAATVFDDKGRAAEAARTWQEIYSLADDNRQSRAAILQLVARNELKVPGGLEAADSRLSAAEKLDPSAKLTSVLSLPNGKTLSDITVQEARLAVDKFIDETTATSGGNLPDIGLPPHSVARAYRAAHQPLSPFLPDDPAADISGVDKLVTASQLFARNDRITAWTNGRGLSIYPIRKAEAIGTDAGVADEPRGEAWVGDYSNLLTWTRSTLQLIDGDQVKSQWTLDLTSLDDLDVISEPAPRQEVNPISAPDPRTRQRMQRNQLIVTPQFQIRISEASGAGSGPVDDTEDATVAASGPESITQVVPVNDMALVATSNGRVMAVKLSDGSIVWQNRLADRAVNRLEATADFTVVLSGDDTSARLAILNTTTGELIGRKVFTADASYPGQPADFPINLALGADGTLAYSLEDRVVLYDLFEAGRDPHPLDHINPTPVLPGKLQLFQGMNKPGQLIVHAGLVLALADGGRFLCGYDVAQADFRGIRVTDEQGAHITPMVLPTGDGDDQSLLRISGRYIYAWGPHWITAYNLDDPAINWGPQDLMAPSGTTGTLLLGRDYLVVLNQPADAGAWRMSAFWRATLPPLQPTTESGVLAYQQELSDPHGILAAEAVDGGLVYLAGDHTLHLLRGNRVPPALGAN